MCTCANARSSSQSSDQSMSNLSRSISRQTEQTVWNCTLVRCPFPFMSNSICVSVIARSGCDHSSCRNLNAVIHTKLRINSSLIFHEGAVRRFAVDGLLCAVLLFRSQRWGTHHVNWVSPSWAFGEPLHELVYFTEKFVIYYEWNCETRRAQKHVQSWWRSEDAWTDCNRGYVSSSSL